MSSYKGKFGSVRYYVRAVLDRPSQHALQCEKEFEVEEPLDVNRADLLVRRHANTPTHELKGGLFFIHRQFQVSFLQFHISVSEISSLRF